LEKKDMATKKTETEVAKNPTMKEYEKLNARVTDLEKLVQQLVSQKPKARKQREYSDEERASIRARLLAGQEAARKKREAEVRTSKKAVETEPVQS
jgi:hypothetical protein